MPSRSLRAVLPALVLLLSACGDDATPGGPSAGPSSPIAPTAPAASAVALEDLDTATLSIPRTDLCADLPASAVESALRGEVRRSETWADGEQARLSPDVRDVAHEDGCRFDGPARTTAAAWVFAPPVSPERADALADAARAQVARARVTRAEVASTAAGRRCRDVPDAASYGDPSVAQTCRSGPLRETRYAGLVGDAWLTCSLSAPRSVERTDLEARAEAWCAAVLVGAAPDQTAVQG